MKVFAAVPLITSVVILSGCSEKIARDVVSELKREGGGVRGLGGSGRTLVTVGDGSIHMNSDQLNNPDAGIWTADSNGNFSTSSFNKIAAIGVMSKKSSNVVKVCYSSGGSGDTPCPSAVEIDFNDSGDPSKPPTGTITIAKGDSGGVTITLAGSDGAGTKWYLFGDDERGVDDAASNKHEKLIAIKDPSNPQGLKYDLSNGYARVRVVLQ